MSHTANGQTASYVWDVNRGVPEILQDGTNTYVYGIGLISATDGSGNQTYYTHDGLGSTTDLTNSSAVKTDGYTYDAFGAPTHSPGNSANTFQFTGQQRDADSGLQYLRARYYDPSTGRFLSHDPLSGQLGVPQTQNPYAYVLNNPTSRVDPLGLCGFTDPTDCVSDVVDPVVDTVTQTVDQTVDQIHVPENVWRPLAGAGLIIVVDVPVFVGEPLCFFTVWTGFTCVAVNWYAIAVATPATYVGLCIYAKSNFVGIPGLGSLCGNSPTASAVGNGKQFGPGKE